ncbi:MAG: hypothetical protein COU31_00460 [Candidatus Magasanikbacteria bacterium CG10_big_fil_rev_8_21_14_0_10_40_10]|uniref:Glycosyltransferase family 1 protein n=1 Tax=Candidatus Magasanikbacteria bacterium CG10_big_fil_rev_8_21_14_0_10_40_10 TaxID=1974648 RepID=A0A2M6W514_9BACT|nr:MAG: hypothetical protein COU31_00460 [Candidatus Magasanikbacteria bacterium CG10_big_fil_rev_8_21_14_0_10_40_10]
MKIAQIVSTFWPRVGGMGRVCFDEAAGLARRNHQVTVFTPQYGEQTADEDELPKQFGFEVIRLQSFLRSDNAAYLPGLVERLRGFDLAHLHYPFYLSAQSVWRARKKFSLKYVLTYHMDAQVNGLKKVAQKMYDWHWVKKIFEEAQKIITIDKDHLDSADLRRFVRSEQLMEIYNGVDLDVFSPKRSAQESDKKNLTDARLLFVGNLLSFKRFDLILKALLLLNQSANNPNCVLTVAGGGFGGEKYQAMAERMGLADKIKVISSDLNRNDLAKIYNQSDALIVSSDSGESFSLAAAEASACGLPVIASNIAGVRGRVEDGQTGYLFASGSADDLAEKIEKFLSLPAQQKKQMSERSRALAEQKYDIKKHVEKLEKLYLSL